MSNKFHIPGEQKFNYLEAMASGTVLGIASHEIEEHLLEATMTTPPQIIENQRNPMWCGHHDESEAAHVQRDDRFSCERFPFPVCTTPDLLDGTGEHLLQPIWGSMVELGRTQSIRYMSLFTATNHLFDSSEDEQQQELDEARMASTVPVVAEEENEIEINPNISQHNASAPWHSDSDLVVCTQERPGKVNEKFGGNKNQKNNSSFGNDHKIKVKEPNVGTSKASNVKMPTNGKTNLNSQEKGKIEKELESQSFLLNSVSVDKVKVENERGKKMCSIKEIDTAVNFVAENKMTSVKLRDNKVFENIIDSVIDKASKT